MKDTPKAAPTAVRIGDDRLAHLESWAEKQGIRSRHAAILAAIDKGCGFKPRQKKAKAPKKSGPAKAAAAKAALVQAETAAAHLAAPKPRSRWDLSSVQTGPSAPAPGSLLKGPKRK